MTDASFSRRQLLAAGGCLAVAGAAPSIAAAPAGSADAALHALLTAQTEADLRRNPTSATSLGIDTGPRAELRSQMPDWSAAGLAERRRSTTRDLADLRAIGRARLSDKSKVSYDIAEFELVQQDALANRFPYHTSGLGHRAGPYAVTQLGGFYTALPQFLDTTHPVKNKADADAYMARMAAVPGLFDADTRIVTENAAMGVIAPRFILEQAVRQLTRLRDGEPKDKTMVRSIARRTGELGLSGYHDQALALWSGPITASLTRQIETLNGLLPRAGTNAGVARLPNGPAYYAQVLKLHTTTELPADEIHRLGLEQVADLSSRIDTLFKAQGMTQGSVRARLEALKARPGQLFPNTDAGRTEIIAYLNQLLVDIRPKLGALFNRLPTSPYEIRRVPPEIEAGAPGGSAQRGSLDGSRPGIFYINLRDTADWPRYSLPTLAYHEGAPGHLFDGALSLENAELPLYRQLASATAHGEGWGLYSEQLADELGVYADDPFGEIGYLSAYLFRATRLVVDTGMHSKGWSREQAIAYMTENSNESAGSAETEIHRYIVYPGQACAYKIGQTVIARLRAEQEAKPGFDIKRFHDLVLGEGRMPLSVLERRVREGMRA